MDATVINRSGTAAVGLELLDPLGIVDPDSHQGSEIVIFPLFNFGGYGQELPVFVQVDIVADFDVRQTEMLA